MMTHKPHSHAAAPQSERLVNHQFSAKNPLRIGTRQSPLAMVQTRMVQAQLLAHYAMEESAIILVPMLSSGDKITDRPLADIGGKALWTKELERAQLDGEIDLAVHSMKDVETIRPDDFCIAAMLARASTTDRIIGATSIAMLKEGAKVGTSSPRRKAQLLAMRPDLRCESIRGNVATRLNKVKNGEFDATLLAGAGLDRLGMGTLGHDIDLLPAASQGAIGIECLSKRDDLRAWISAINHDDTMICVNAERSFLARLGGDCHSPIAAIAVRKGEHIHLQGQILSPDGRETETAEIISAPQDADKAAHDLAETLLGRASASLRGYFEA